MEPAHAYIENEEIVIRVPFGQLASVVEGAWATGKFERRWKITDTAVFAENLCGELNDEEEDGTTLVHVMFDNAIDKVIESGGEGIDEHEDQEA